MTVTLAALLAQSSLRQVQTAMVARVDAHFADVAVVAHPGKLDVNDAIEKQIVAAPGVAIGWTRTRASRETAGHFGLPVEWAAFVVAEDKPVANRRVSREDIGHAIGSELLRLLNDPDVSTWGVAGLAHPEADPAPEFRPLFTVKSAGEGVALYAVTWTQRLVDLGLGAFGGATPVIDESAFPNLTIDQDAMPPELRAIVRDHYGDDGP